MLRDYNVQSLHVRNDSIEELTKPCCKRRYLKSQTVVKRNGKVTLSNRSNSLKLRPTTIVACEHLHVVTLRLFGTTPSPYLGPPSLELALSCRKLLQLVPEQLKPPAEVSQASKNSQTPLYPEHSTHHGGAIGDARHARRPQRLGHFISYKFREPKHVAVRQPRQDSHHLELDSRRPILRLPKAKFTRPLPYRL